MSGISKEWCLNMADLEGDAEIGAGLLAMDPSEGAADGRSAAALMAAIRRYGPQGEPVTVRVWPNGDWDVYDPARESSSGPIAEPPQ